jgi:hypothetical protein
VTAVYSPLRVSFCCGAVLPVDARSESTDAFETELVEPGKRAWIAVYLSKTQQPPYRICCNLYGG